VCRKVCQPIRLVIFALYSSLQYLLQRGDRPDRHLSEDFEIV